MFIYCPWFQICKPFIIFPKTAIFIIHYHIEWINCGLLRNATFHTRSRYLLWNLHLRLKYILKFRKLAFKNFDNLRKMIQREELYVVRLNSCWPTETTVFSRTEAAASIFSFHEISAASIKRRLLIKGGFYSRKYGKCNKQKHD